MKKYRRCFCEWIATKNKQNFSQNNKAVRSSFGISLTFSFRRGAFDCVKRRSSVCMLITSILSSARVQFEITRQRKQLDCKAAS